MKRYSKEYYEKNRERILEKNRLWKEKHKRRYAKSHREGSQKYRNKHRTQIRKAGREYYYRTRDKTLKNNRIKWKQDAEFRKRIKRNNKKWKAKNPNHQREYVAKNRKRVYEAYYRYYQKNKQKHNEWTKKWRLKNPKKYKAQQLAQKINIPKGQICEICKIRKATIRHHEDYSKPYEVKFVCGICHKGKLHNKNENKPTITR